MICKFRVKLYHKTSKNLRSKKNAFQIFPGFLYSQFNFVLGLVEIISKICLCKLLRYFFCFRNCKYEYTVTSIYLIVDACIICAYMFVLIKAAGNQYLYLIFHSLFHFDGFSFFLIFVRYCMIFFHCVFFNHCGSSLGVVYLLLIKTSIYFTFLDNHLLSDCFPWLDSDKFEIKDILTQTKGSC